MDDSAAYVTLTAGALWIQRSYLQTRDLMLKGELVGVRRGSRYFVTVTSIEQYLRAEAARGATRPPMAASA